MNDLVEVQGIPGEFTARLDVIHDFHGDVMDLLKKLESKGLTMFLELLVQELGTILQPWQEALLVAVEKHVFVGTDDLQV